MIKLLRSFLLLTALIFPAFASATYTGYYYEMTSGEYNFSDAISNCQSKGSGWDLDTANDHWETTVNFGQSGYIKDVPSSGITNYKCWYEGSWPEDWKGVFLDMGNGCVGDVPKYNAYPGICYGPKCVHTTSVGSWGNCNASGVQVPTAYNYAVDYSNTCTDTAPTSRSCPVNGACSATHYNCAAGSLGGTAEYWNQYQWWCVGINGGSNVLCAEAKPINGACAATHYNCAAGSLGGTAEYGTQYDWWCNGINGGATAPLCHEYKVISGACAATHYNCAAGSLGSYAEYGTQYDWWCNGINGGATAPLCHEYKPIMNGVNVSCNAAGTQATISWSAQNATSYAIRLDKDSASWNPQSCNIINPGDLCQSYGSNSVVVNTTPGNPNNFWVHACNASIGCNWANFGQNVFACYAPPTSLTVTGPTTGNVNTTYVFTAKATDPQNSDITYKFTWGDGGTQSNSPPAKSGTPVSLPHSWTTSGSKTISVTACNSFGLCSAPATLNILISNCAATNPAWSECTQSCGNEGTQTRSVFKTDCLIDNQTQACNRVDCPQWKEVIP